jgi:hypothetical protein
MCEIVDWPWLRQNIIKFHIVFFFYCGLTLGKLIIYYDSVMYMLDIILF